MSVDLERFQRCKCLMLRHLLAKCGKSYSQWHLTFENNYENSKTFNTALSLKKSNS